MRSYRYSAIKANPQTKYKTKQKRLPVKENQTCPKKPPWREENFVVFYTCKSFNLFSNKSPKVPATVAIIGIIKEGNQSASKNKMGGNATVTTASKAPPIVPSQVFLEKWKRVVFYQLMNQLYKPSYHLSILKNNYQWGYPSKINRVKKHSEKLLISIINRSLMKYKQTKNRPIILVSVVLFNKTSATGN